MIDVYLIDYVYEGFLNYHLAIFAITIVEKIGFYFQCSINRFWRQFVHKIVFSQVISITDN